ncbi:TPA: site-specific integrase, partial [Burkholderia vietnamiensis]|nr:site-specific integrase [Burkholderia vietnamiensis]
MTQTKSPKTDEGYAIRALQIRNRVARELGYFSPYSVPALTIVDHLIGRKPTIAKNTWKQYKNALRSHFQTLAIETDDSVALEELRVAIAVLDAESSTGAMKRGTRTSATKQKGFKQADFDRFLAYLNANVGRHRFANALRTWLLASRITGLRPSEWEHAGLAEIGGRPCLIVKNGKATNLRANGTFRTLDLSATSTADVQAVHEILAMLE